MSDVIDITDLVKELCVRVDMDYESCICIEITKDRVIFEGALKNANGSPLIDPLTGEFTTEKKILVRT
jgi:hypothetical protein